MHHAAMESLGCWKTGAKLPSVFLHVHHHPFRQFAGPLPRHSLPPPISLFTLMANKLRRTLFIGLRYHHADAKVTELSGQRGDRSQARTARRWLSSLFYIHARLVPFVHLVIWLGRLLFLSPLTEGSRPYHSCTSRRRVMLCRHMIHPSNQPPKHLASLSRPP